MSIDLIVVGITLLMVGFIVIWWLYPSHRSWIEAPKYRILTWEPGAVRETAPLTPPTPAGAPK